MLELNAASIRMLELNAALLTANQIPECKVRCWKYKAVLRLNYYKNDNIVNNTESLINICRNINRRFS
ncbi:hypothetical protein DPMN_090138 [Dreissena polymorpha]|uniref:Uncharacterized protein n=1 Tax=Dreissena polymorpha TaxID=45954 RepID=A0A9D4KX65_DREPO|nr:hypothetical protein DPMN_090138 [Dreissena polymorpha]